MQAIIAKWKKWRTGVSIPVPLECESSALPFELVPLARGISSLTFSCAYQEYQVATEKARE